MDYVESWISVSISGCYPGAGRYFGMALSYEKGGCGKDVQESPKLHVTPRSPTSYLQLTSLTLTHK